MPATEPSAPDDGTKARPRPFATRQSLLARLEALGLATKTYDHAPVFTVEESQSIKVDMPGGHTKNLFLKDKKGAFLLISARDQTQINLKALHRPLACGRLSFGKPERLLEMLGVTPGSVTGFALINDPQAKVRFILDQALMEMDPVNFHPLENTATTAIAPDDFLTFAKACGHTPQIFDFAKL
jgi:Ala-tRNA(Pro) deacylase